MRADVVVDGLVAVDSGGEGSSVTDLIAVEILVLESLEEALDERSEVRGSSGSAKSASS